MQVVSFHRVESRGTNADWHRVLVEVFISLRGCALFEDVDADALS